MLRGRWLSSMVKLNSQSETAILVLGLFTLASCVLMILSGYYCFWSDSEMWAITTSRDLFYPHLNPGDHFLHLKLGFHLINAFLFRLAGALDLFPMIVGRVFVGFCSVTTVALCFLIVYKCTRSSLRAMLAAFVVASSQIFIEQGSRLRSDLVVVPFLLGMILILVSDSQLKTKDFLRLVGISALSFLITPKVVLFLVALLPLILHSFPLTRQNRKMWLGAAGFFTIVLVAGEGLFSLRYFIESFSFEGTAVHYWSYLSFSYLFQFFRQDPQFLLIWISSIALLVLRRKWSTQDRALLAMSVLSGLALMLHSEKLPFFIMSGLPLITVGFFAQTIPNSKINFNFLNQLKMRIIMLTVLCLVWARSFYVFHYIHSQHNNLNQITTMRQLSTIVGQGSSLEIFDPVGVLPFSRSHLWYLGPGQRQQNQLTLSLIQSTRPDVILYTQRLQWIEAGIRELLEREYLDFGGGFYVRTVRLQFPDNGFRFASRQLIQSLQNEKFCNAPDKSVWVRVQHEDPQLYVVTKNKRVDVMPQPLVCKNLSAYKALIHWSHGSQLYMASLPIESHAISPLHHLFRFDSEL